MKWLFQHSSGWISPDSANDEDPFGGFRIERSYRRTRNSSSALRFVVLWTRGMVQDGLIGLELLHSLHRGKGGGCFLNGHTGILNAWLRS